MYLKNCQHNVYSSINLLWGISFIYSDCVCIVIWDGIIEIGMAGDVLNCLNLHIRSYWNTKVGLNKYFHFFRRAYHQPTSYRPRLLIAGEPGFGQASHLAPAVIHALEKFTVYTLDLSILFGVSGKTPEEMCAQVLMLWEHWFWNRVARILDYVK